MPSGASLQAGTLNANLELSGPTNKLVTSGNVGMFNAKLAGFDLGSKLAAVSKLVGVNTGKDLDIEKMTTDLRMAPTDWKRKIFKRWSHRWARWWVMGRLMRKTIWILRWRQR